MKWSMNWSLFRRSLAAGEFRTLLLALTIAIAALSSVGSITERVQHLLLGQANETLGADLVLRSDHEIAAPLSNAAQVQDLRVAKTATFPSMVGVHPQASAPVAAGEQHVAAASISAETEPAALTLASVKAVSALYPLRGDLRLQDGTRTTAPQAGQALIDQRLQSMLGIEVGSILDVGLLQLRVVGILGQEPDAAFDFSSLQPRLMMNDADLAASGLLGFGSRVKYRLMLAGDTSALAEWRLQATPQLERGQKLESVSDARPELKDALDRASRFLKLAALLAACLAAVAMILAARRFALRHYDMVALLRTFGATRRQVQQILLVQLALVAAMAALLGGVLGWLSQSALVALLKSSLPAPLPAGSSLPWLLASVLGLVLLLGCAGPMLMALAQTPPLRVLRREIEPSARVGLQWLVTAGLMLGLLYWIANDIQLALMVGAGVLLALALAGGLGLVLLRGLQRILPGATVKIALRQLQRQRVLVAAQLGALSLGLMGIALLTVVQSDLLSAWQRQILANAPNHFAINIQPEQASAVAQQFSQQGLAAPTLLPMIRGRWLALNQQAVEPERYSEARAQRLAEREFNLSVAPSSVREQGKIVAGQPLQANIPAWSVEEGLAKTLGIAVGDTLTFDVGGIPISAPVANLRQVAWESFQVNFFVMGSASLLQAQTGSWISSFYLPPNQTQWIASWVRAMPNITVIDVGQVLNEVQRVMTLASSVLRLVLILCVLAGLTVLIAALDTTESERRREAAIMRALGATSKRLAAVWWVESLLLGAVAGLIAGVCASVLGWCLATQLLNIPMALNLLLPLYTLLLGMFLAALTVWRRLRVFAQTTPMVLLKD
ncbi:ABC transporter permease [Deefgea salmonis]|uniref:FtsX-like permease family protein n=1 Tax=Deefgea salmonis TaxID=2875502 RepID=A0ABS8BKD5_9NEIS|nr:FtsX-like permease family protein [Deefgea salmonis]MCB5196164.1 FtsX-like permease family protein [Deefgea salmonis]